MNKTVTQFVFAAALLVAMLAATGIVQAQVVNFQGVPENNDIRISWMKPVTGESSFSYFVAVKPSGGSTVNTTIPVTNAGSFDRSISSLLSISVANGTSYQITIRPKAEGASSSQMGSGLSVVAGAPLEPTNFTSTGFADAVVLTWTAPASDNGAAITEYQIVHYDTGNKNDALDVKLGGNARTHTLSNRVPDREIILTLTARNSRGRSTKATYEVTPQGAPVARPSIVLAGPDSGSSDSDRITSNRGILITLASNFDFDRDSWEISINGGANYNHTSEVEARSTNLLRFELPDGEYTDNQIRVRQTVNTVTSEYAGLDAFIFDATPPVVTVTSLASITLDVGGTYNEVGATATDILDDNVPKPTTTDTVDTGTAGIYTITYRATDHAGNTGTAERTVTVNPAPPILRSGAITPTSIVIEWDAVDGATEYNLFSDGNLITTTSELSYTDTGLAPETEYTYHATSTNPAGTSGASNNLILTTTAVEPTLTIERLRDNSLRLTWADIPTVRGLYNITLLSR